MTLSETRFGEVEVRCVQCGLLIPWKEQPADPEDPEDGDFLEPPDEYY